jgi:hypothetical protein
MNVGGESSEMAVSLMAVLYEEMEVVWPSGVALRGVASNRPPGLWLKTVVLNGVGKGVIRNASGVDRKDERWAEALCRLKRRKQFSRHQNRGVITAPG